MSDPGQPTQRLTHGEEGFRLLAEAIPNIVWTCFDDGRLEFLNRAWVDYTGMAPDHSVNTGWAAVIHPDDQEAAKNNWREAVRSGKRYEAETRLRRFSDGTYRWHLVRATRVSGADGSGSKWFGTLTDIHDQKSAEEQQRFFARASALLSQSLLMETTLRRIAQLATERFGGWCTIALPNDKGSIDQITVVEASNDWARKDGNSPDQYFRRYPLEPDMPFGPARVIKTGLTEYMAEIPASVMEETARDDEHREIYRQVALRSYICVALQARGKVYGAINFAANDRAYSQADVEVAEEFAKLASLAVDNADLYHQSQEALRSRDEFLSIASHELKTPLAALYLLLERMREEMNARQISGELPRLLAKCDNNSDRLAQLVENLLDLTRIRQSKFEIMRSRFDLAELVGEIVGRQSFTHSNIDFEFSAPSPVLGHWDRSRIEQVVTNLLSNAMKYGNGKPIRVSVEHPQGGEFCRVVVRDQGIGVGTEDQARVFSIFERAANAVGQGGLGLGLYITRQIVEAHQGRISLQSELNQGTTVMVELPLGGVTG